MNGTKYLIDLFENEDRFIEHFISCTKFFTPQDVKERAVKMLEEIESNNQLPVRYSLKIKENFSCNQGKVGAIKNRKHAMKFSRDYELTHDLRGIRVECDATGNKHVVDCIKEYTGYSISTGKTSDLINYTIGHVWARTDDPLFFTSLWNIVIVPTYLGFILDKPQDQHKLNADIQGIIKAICLKLYNPNQLMQGRLGPNELDDKNSYEDTNKYNSKAEEFIKNGIVKFIGRKGFEEIIQDQPKIETVIPVKNKDFVLSQLGRLSNADVNLIPVLTDAIACLTHFEMSFPILKVFVPESTEIIFYDVAGNTRYYKNNTFFEYNGIRYIVCNHWFPTQREKFKNWMDKHICK